METIIAIGLTAGIGRVLSLPTRNGNKVWGSGFLFGPGIVLSLPTRNGNPLSPHRGGITSPPF